MIKVNGTAVKTPKEFSVDIEDLDSTSTRNALGQLTRDRIAVKRKLKCVWGPLTNDEISTILQAVSDVFFNVTYPDPQTGRLETKVMYVGTRSAPVYYWDNESNVAKWKDLSMNFIER